ncbi:MAG: potassium channel family protein [Armatimonadota bacterium]
MYIVIAGGGLVGKRLTSLLSKRRHDVVVIEIDPEVCEQLYAETGALAINGNATNMDVLKEARLGRADVAVALTGSDSDNMAFCLLANQFGVPRIVGRVREPDYETAYRAAGASALTEVTNLVVHQMHMAIEQPGVQRLASLGSGRAEVVLVTIPRAARAAGRSIEEIAKDRDFPTDCVFAGIYRSQEDDFMVPRGGEKIAEGDRVFLAAAGENITRAADYLLKT